MTTEMAAFNIYIYVYAPRSSVWPRRYLFTEGVCMHTFGHGHYGITLMAAIHARPASGSVTKHLCSFRLGSKSFSCWRSPAIGLQ